jgi:hypothetical protein
MRMNKLFFVFADTLLNKLQVCSLGFAFKDGKHAVQVAMSNGTVWEEFYETEIEVTDRIQELAT